MHLHCSARGEWNVCTVSVSTFAGGHVEGRGSLQLTGLRPAKYDPPTQPSVHYEHSYVSKAHLG